MIRLDKKSKTPLYDQLYLEIRDSIITGKMKKGTKLTAVRVMAKDLGVSKNTVETAYKQLMAEGFIVPRKGSGYYVENIESDYALAKTGDMNYLKNAENQEKKRESSHFDNKIIYNFRYSSIEVSNFPWKKWKHYVGEAIADMEYQDYVSYESSKGNKELRGNIKKFLGDNRGVKCSTSQIILCSGTQHAAEIVANLLGENGLNVAFEEPGFYTTRNIFKKSGCRVVSVDVRADGIDIEKLSTTQSKLVYVTPSRQMPTGVVMPLERRKELLKWAEKNDAYIFEDDYDSEFRYGSMPIPSIQSLDTNDRVIYVGTFSKILLPSFRLAYLVLPQSLLKLYEKKYRYFNSFLPTSHQIATSKFMEDGSLDRHMRKIINLNEKKCDVLRKSLMKYMGNQVSFYGEPGGTHLLVKINNAGDEESVLNKLKAKGYKYTEQEPSGLTKKTVSLICLCLDLIP